MDRKQQQYTRRLALSSLQAQQPEQSSQKDNSKRETGDRRRQQGHHFLMLKRPGEKGENNGEHCDQKSQPERGRRRQLRSVLNNQDGDFESSPKCDRVSAPAPTQRRANALLSSLSLAVMLAIATQASTALAAQAAHNLNHNSSLTLSPIIIDQQPFLLASGAVAGSGKQQATTSQLATPIGLAGAHLQPSFVYGARNKSVNFTHVVVDELTGSVYVGATNMLLQLSAANLKAEFALKTGPAIENSRDCAPADCLAHIAHIDANSLPNIMHHAHGADLRIPATTLNQQRHHSHHHHYWPAGSTMHTVAASSIGNNETMSHSPSYAFLAAQRASTAAAVTTNGQRQTSGAPPSQSSATSQQQTQANQSHNNNYNKILAIEPDSRQLIVCGSLNQGACRRHQLGSLTNYSELIPLPVASNDEHSSSVALVSSVSRAQQRPIMYVAATNSRLGPYREMVPAISARYLEPANRAMQIIERSFTDSARVDISFELRDYYLVNYVHAFQYNDYVYFATVQRKSPLRQLEEWGYVSRLARLCLSDLSFQSYTEITLECRSATASSSALGGTPINSLTNQQQRRTSSTQHNSKQQQQVGSANGGSVNYNLLQDAYVTSASSHLAQQLGIRSQSAVLVGAFALSKDHTTRSQQRSAVCLFPLAQIEQKFNENIHMCYNGISKARNMNYIAGSVNDCPKPGKAGNVANFCNEPIKLNGSLPLTATPVLSYDDVLLTSIAATQAPTSPVNLNNNADHHHHHHHQQQQQQSATGNQQQRRHLAAARQHQVLLAGTSSGALKRIALVSGEFGFGLKGVEFDSVQVDEHQDPILADLHVTPASNPQVNGGGSSQQQQQVASDSGSQAQFVIAAAPSKLVKLRVNQCKALSRANGNNNNNNKSSSFASDECNACAQLQDPFCGWCATSSSCSTRDDCLINVATAPTVHWLPFDQIKCADYQPVSPQFVPIQTSGQQAIDVNIRIQQPAVARDAAWDSALAFQLAQAQFTCHFDYLALANRSAPAPRLSGATTKATQARLNLHTSTVVIACPLPPPAQRPQIAEELHLWGAGDQLRARLTVRLVAPQTAGQQAGSAPATPAPADSLQQLLGMRLQHQQPFEQVEAEIEREISLYDCTVHSSCRSCLTAGATLATASGITARDWPPSSLMRRWSCSWCPLSNKCTFNSSHPDFGCAASAVISTTPHSALPSPSSNSVRASHLTQSLDQAQATVFGMSIERAAQCPGSLANENSQAASQTTTIVAESSSSTSGSGSSSSSSSSGSSSDSQAPEAVKSEARARGSQPVMQQSEILIPNNSRRSIQVSLRQALPLVSINKLQRANNKLECLIEVEGARARLSAKLLDGGQLVVCQEGSFSYQEEIATQRAQLLVVQGDNQVIDIFDVILYKCHLFGVSPPALTSTIGATGGAQHSSAAWRAHEMLQFAGGARQAPIAKRQSPGGSSDCSLCLNVERKYQCAWCSNSCQHADQCIELQASTCPPPRIDSIHPTAGPLEGGTLITIEGSNLGSNEREIQDKISVGGEPCQLVMYSVSTRIVCKTGPSLHGPQSATVFVGNRAGVTSAYEKFHYKAVHLTDVNPRVGPVSGGTRLYLTGSNLNIGSRVQIFLDDIPCSLDSNDISNNQITCITAPNLLASSTRITKLTLMIDNSTHYLPYPFTYQPDPVITSIEPAESFVSGGRLILIAGQHLSSPQSIKLMVYHEHRHNIINGTNCITQNDTLITCLTPALSREMLANLLSPPANQDAIGSGDREQQQQQQLTGQLSLSYESGGLKLKMSLFMDDVRSSRNLDEYYHHLPHYLTYYDDPQLFRLPTPVIEFAEELVILGENLKMRQLDQDMLITIGSHICPIKLVNANQVICEPSQKIAPVYDESGRLMERPILPIVGLVGSNLRYQIGYMQYSSRQYQVSPADSSFAGSNLLNSSPSMYPSTSGGMAGDSMGSGGTNSTSVLILICLSVLGFIIGFVSIFMFAMARFRQSKAEREYKRIQLQMGSLDTNGQPINGSLFDKIHLSNGQSNIGHLNVRNRALDYVGGALSGKKLFYQLNQPSFPPSPLTDISSLTGSNPLTHNQHVVKLSSNGTIINSTAHHIYNSANSSSSQSSPGSTRNSGQLFSQNSSNNSSGLTPQLQQHHSQNQQQQQLNKVSTSDKSNLIAGGQQANANGNSRNFSWTQEAPLTIVPYAVIEACSLTFEGKSAIKEFV